MAAGSLSARTLQDYEDAILAPTVTRAHGALRKFFQAPARLEDITSAMVLIGHENKSTTEFYIKQRWRETAQPNIVSLA